MADALPRLADPAPGSTLQGRVVDSAQKPIHAAQIPLRIQGAIEPSQSAQTNSAGDYKMEGIRPGVYELLVYASYFAQSTVKGIHVTDNDHLTVPDIEIRKDRLPFGDCSPENPSLLFDMLPQESAGGGLIGIVHDPDGKAVMNASVIVFVSGRKKVGTTKSNHAGLFSLINLVPARGYNIAVEREGFFPEQVSVAVIQAGLLTNVPAIVLEPCKRGQCQQDLKQVRIRPTCE